ncbi:GA-like domain-containing protein [Staphylococcus xylosus]|uniref:GA-like domain-containing protein n=5 Tax=Staphylococcus xylosus TaxID=1288 RepID=UPI001CDC17EF|nr:YSIRK-type signal peptide-containing protein [Staphylococcus xylosus]UBV40292.1 YSIRK-type signal peptide-containing protein [Staphylococcus xylosus]
MKKVNSLFNEKQRYSIRKYHIGAASIIIGSVVFMNTGSLSYASEVDNKASEIVENEIHTNKERISNIDTAVQEKEDNKANSTIENQNNNPENQKSELKKEVSLVTELPISAPLLEKDNSKNDTQEKEVNKADKQLNDQINSGESPKQVIQENKDNQVEEHSNKNNNQIKDSKTGEVSNYHETELINKEDNLKVDGTDDTNKVVISQNENRQKVRRKRNVVNPSNDNNLTNDDYNKNANQMNTDVSSDGTMTYQWYPVIGGLSSQERFLITNGYGDNENRARKKATMLWLISNFDFTKEQRQSFKIQDLNSPLFGDDVYKWLEEAKKGNIIPKQGTMNLGRRNEMIISANNIILSDNKGFDRGIINFGDTRNFTPSDSDDVNNTTITSSDIDFGFTLKPPFEKIGVDNTWAVSDNEKEEIKSAIRKANSNINFVNINVSYNGTVFAQALNSSGEIVDSADLNANTVIIDKIFIEKKEKLDTLISLVENTKLLDESLYTPASINFLQRELDYTSIVIRDSYDPEINTIPDIISATNRLDYAIKSLVRRANVTELQNAISNAKNQGPFDNNIEEDQAIILALEVGENTVGNENTPQDVVDTVTTNINNALRERLQVKNLLQDVETLVNEAEEKNRNASNMVVTALTDGIFSNNENNTLTELVNSANNKKAEAQDKINLLPDSKKAPFQNRIDSLPTISIPEVNDADGNGIADDVDQAKAQAESKVSEAEAADQAVKTKLVEYQQDGLITASEKTDLDSLAATAQSKKAEAQGLVDALPDGLKNDLVTRLNNLTGIQVPAVNDADGNGIADDVDQGKAQAESKVSEAEAADQAAKTKLTEYQQDGLITASEKADLDNLVTTAQSKKTEAQGLVDALPDGLKNDLVTRLNNLTGIQVPAVNDADGNGIADDVDQGKAQAESKVSEAEAADQAAKTKLVEYQQDGLITASEKTDLDSLAATAQSKKAEAQGLVDALPNGLKNDLVTRLNNLTGIQVPTVNDADGNGIADDVDQAKAQAESKVSEAEAADQAAKTKLTEYQQDGLITASEKADLDNLVTTAQSKKTEAQGLVDALPDGLKNDLATRLNNLTGIQVPEVNDADGNGIADDVDQAKAQAESKVSEAEAADQAAKTKLTEYQQDGLITASEKADLDNLVTTAQSKKTEAQGLVDALPDGLKNDLATRLNNLTGIQVPEVNDADGNGIADDVDQAKAQAESKVSEAEAADQAAKTKLTEYQQDGLITASEKADLDNLVTTAQSKKTEAQGLVDALPDGLKNDLATRLNNLTGIQVPEVNDADGNGIADDVDQAKAQAESKVSEAEAADQAAKTKLTEYQQDGLITASEKADLDNLVTTAQSKKTEAQGLVDALPDGLKNDLVTRLNNLTGIQVPAVNDADGNGIADDVDQAKAQAESKVTEAEASYQAAKVKLSEYQQDGLITLTEREEIEELIVLAEKVKREAQKLVDALAESDKGDLSKRLDNLVYIQLPLINDADGNGIADDIDSEILKAENSVINAEVADKTVKDKLTEYQQDGLVSSNEKRELINLLTKAQRAKAEAQVLVDALSSEFRGDLPSRLNKLTGIEIPKVNDADNDGKKDDVDELKALVETKVQEAEAAHQNALAKLSEYQRDGLINQWEKNDILNLSHEVFSKKARAFALVDGLPKEQQDEFLNRLNKLTDLPIPEINDKNNNGIADDVDETKAQAESKVSEAEAANQAAKTKLTEYQQDGLITASEKADLENLATTAQTAKTGAQGLVDALPDVLKGDLPTRLNNLTGIQVPEVNDADGNGIVDDKDRAQAESKVTEAEAADQATKTKLTEYQQDELITASEKADLENLLVTAQSKKAEAQGLVDALPDVLKGDMATRLNNLTGIQVPEVNDADGNGIADNVDQAKARAENKVTEAEAADQATKTKLTEYQQDGLITASEKADLENLLVTAQSKKAEAQGLVDALPDVLKGDMATRLNNLTGIQVPEVNDADGNGIADDVDQAKAQAESKVSEAEAADQAAKTKLTEYQQDGLITASEKADLDNLVTTAQSKKTEAQGLVDALPDGLKNDLATRLNNLTGIQVPEVNDADGNGIADDVDQAKAQAESKVSEAEAADQAAKTKLTEYQQDGLITASEKTDLDSLAATAQSKKAEAQGLVDALPDVLKGDLSTRLNNLTGIQVPAVNDADGNGIADDIDQAKAQAESKVTEAEAADQAAKTKLSEYQQDGLITASEKADLEKLAAIAQSKKAEAQKLVDAIPNDVKEALQNRLNRLEGIVVPSVSVNSNNGQSNSHNMQGKDDINKNKDTLQKSPALSSNPQKTLNSKADTSNDASNDMKGTHMSTANNESTNTTKLNINSDNTKRGKSNNVKVLSPSKVDEKIDAKTLPNTGEEATKDTTLFGALLASIGSLIVWRSRKKENTKETK